jgi:4-amino-4-deoxy-L-arabinose transferase-like glycosyltransferase
MKRAKLDGPRLWAPVFSVCIAAAVLITRAVTSGSVYYGDGKSHLDAIANHTFVIQPPGYWLFTRIGGLFPNPEQGIHLLNWCFSALGCVVFYACARRLVRSPLAELGTLLYASTFFAWFSGNIHTTHASQLLFAPLMFYAMLRYNDKKRATWLAAVGASFAVAAGLRPSDGAFLIPLLILFALRLPRRHQLILAALVTVLCAAWLIPNQIALHRYIHGDDAGELKSLATGGILFGRLNIYTISNALRFFLPLTVALGPAAFFLFRTWNRKNLLLWAWVLPGSAFFLLAYIADAPYIDCVLGGYILLCLLGLSSCRNHRLAIAMLLCSITVNVGLYLGFRPLALRSGVYAVLERDLGNYTLYAVRHQFQITRLAHVANFTRD